jgi:hypothetical protein
MPHKKMTAFTAVTTVAADDIMIIDDTSAVETKKVTLENLLSVINVLTAETTVDGAADFVAMWDTSASAIRKVLPENLPVSTATTAAIAAAVVGLYDHKGAYDASANSPDLDTSPSGILKGDAYTVSVAGTFYAVAVEAGDVLIADQDDPTLSTHWTIVNKNIDSSAFALASHTHTTTDITSGTFADARIAESNVTQHEAALTITESQISDLGSYLTDITGEALSTLSDVTITSIASGELLAWNGSAWINQTLAEAGISATGHAHAASDITSGTLAHERGGIEADISGVAIGDILAGTGAGTIGIVTSTGHSDGDVLTLQADGTVDFETPSGGGVTDHGALTGLSDDDHPQYAKLAGDTYSGVHDFGGATSVEIPNGAAPTVNAAGEIAVDTTITDYTGLIKYHDGTEELTVLAVPTANLSTTDGEVVAYNATNDELEFIDVVGPYLDSTLGGAAAGDILYHDGTQWTNLAKGSDDEVLTLAGGLPSWAGGSGSAWTSRSATEANSWYSVAYGNGLFVAVSGSGTNRVMTSSDGINWTARSAAEANTWRSITFGNGLFVAVSSDGTNRVMTSPDGTTWTARSAAEANTWFALAYGDGLFVAVSQDGTNRVMTSSDGITWTARSAAEANTWNAVTYNNGIFVAVSQSGTNRVMTSSDGTTWTARTAAEANSWQTVAYGNGLFVAVSSTGSFRVMTSPDGITWTARSAAEANAWRSITYGDGLFVAVSQDGTNRVMTSPDGITWTARSAAEANTWISTCYGNGVFVAVSNLGTNRVQTSGKQQDRIVL